VGCNASKRRRRRRVKRIGLRISSTETKNFFWESKGKFRSKTVSTLLEELDMMLNSGYYI
jgi:hypothetical protein